MIDQWMLFRALSRGYSTDAAGAPGSAGWPGGDSVVLPELANGYRRRVVDHGPVATIRVSAARPLHHRCAAARSRHLGNIMKAAIYEGPRTVTVKDVPDAKIEHP
ncbi:hypothetical protein, partial [Streptomyces sp. NPDC095817]|uniref:hypothetical protein n=1 Tax=Streptomyces sp. NPDC095817 TaxID=3155082 RepID=UPI003318E0D5